MLDVLLDLWQKTQGFDLINQGSKLCILVQKECLIRMKGEDNVGVDVRHEVVDPRCGLAKLSKRVCLRRSR